jgi:hypothetical protein
MNGFMDVRVREVGSIEGCERAQFLYHHFCADDVGLDDVQQFWQHVRHEILGFPEQLYDGNVKNLYIRTGEADVVLTEAAVPMKRTTGTKSCVEPGRLF